jgi:hypothetical protein
MNGTLNGQNFGGAATEFLRERSATSPNNYVGTSYQNLEVRLLNFCGRGATLPNNYVGTSY